MSRAGAIFPADAPLAAGAILPADALLQADAFLLANASLRAKAMSRAGAVRRADAADMTGPYRAVVLDLDGTLIDSAPAIQRIAATYLAGEGKPPLTLDETRAFIGNGARVFCQRMLAARKLRSDPAALEARYPAFHALYAAAPPGDNVPYEGAFAALSRLAEAGVALALCTNKPAAPTHAVLNAFGLAGLFGAVVAGDTQAQIKPSPVPLLSAIAAIGGRPEETLFVGDSEVDAATASAARVAFAFHTPGYAKDPAAITAALRFADWDNLTDAVIGPRGA
ncbi:phosphoglycolate phosphatase [Stappia sp. 22II-S9-Z10]|nr:phosphoglycolate phosphatase [Stappia sp. 22II-S9-Z10]